MDEPDTRNREPVLLVGALTAPGPRLTLRCHFKDDRSQCLIQTFVARPVTRHGRPPIATTA